MSVLKSLQTEAFVIHINIYFPEVAGALLIAGLYADS